MRKEGGVARARARVCRRCAIVGRDVVLAAVSSVWSSIELLMCAECIRILQVVEPMTIVEVLE